MVQKVVGVAERYGVSVEGELGEVGRNPGASGSEIMAMMTDPRQVAEFVDRTGVHSLAVSVGSISGCFDTRIIELDFERLAAISRATAIPLVFHGGTGIPEEQLRRAVPMGVAKVNIAHGLRKAFEDALKLGFCGHADYVDPRPVLKAAMQDVERYAARRLDVFGCTARG
jgi:fructose/tagatose bisphosphate aldolase